MTAENCVNLKIIQFDHFVSSTNNSREIGWIWISMLTN